MWSQRTPVGWVLGLAFAAGAAAQDTGSLRWPKPALGLQAPRLQVNVQAGYAGPTPMERTLQQGQGVKLEGHTAWVNELGVYGRFGAGVRTSLVGSGPANAESATSYGVGVSWDLSPRASAVLGWDSYDFRGGLGERDVRATSLGLQWRY